MVRSFRRVALSAKAAVELQTKAVATSTDAAKRIEEKRLAEFKNAIATGG